MGVHLSGRRLVGAAAIFCVFAPSATAHEVWINKQRRMNPAGEWCCNTYDCSIVQARETPQGYMILNTGEEVPRDETSVSGDGDFWVCRRPDKTRRCFFAPLGS